eukprot:362789-Chlamydomonas_euryale.AAC.3
MVHDESNMLHHESEMVHRVSEIAHVFKLAPIISHLHMQGGPGGRERLGKQRTSEEILRARHGVGDRCAKQVYFGSGRDFLDNDATL